MTEPQDTQQIADLEIGETIAFILDRLDQAMLELED
jgi:hypothetical protein